MPCVRQEWDLKSRGQCYYASKRTSLALPTRVSTERPVRRGVRYVMPVTSCSCAALQDNAVLLRGGGRGKSPLGRSAAAYIRREVRGVPGGRRSELRSNDSAGRHGRDRAAECEGRAEGMCAMNRMNGAQVL
jgi:hypothetical protein